MGNRLSDKEAERRMRSTGLEPLVPYPGSGKPWLCRCRKCKREVTPKLTGALRSAIACAYCAGQRTDTEAVERELLDAGAVPLEPYPGLNERWKARCAKCRRVIGARIRSIRKGVPACGYCAGTIIDPKVAAAEMREAGVTPLEPYPGANQRWRCKCRKCKREVSPSLTNVRAGKKACGYCNHNRADPKDAEKLMRAAGLEPLEPYPGASVPWLCRCFHCGRQVSPRRDGIRIGQSGCKWCSGKRIDPKQALAQMIDAGAQPLAPFPGASKPWRCRCVKCDRAIAPKLANIRQGQSACGYCARRRVDVEAETAYFRAAGFEPLIAYPGATVPWKAKCLKCGASAAPRLTQLRKGVGGCRRCAGLWVDPKDAQKVMRAARLKPLEPYPGSSTPWRCECKRCGREVTPLYLNVRRRGSGCAWCANKLIDPDQAVAEMTEAGAIPLESFHRSDQKWKCKCAKCGRAITPKLSEVRMGRGVCIYCAEYGYKTTRKGFVYLLENVEFAAYKVGISNVPKARLRDLRFFGFELVYLVEYDDGTAALEVETLVLEHVRGKWGLPTGVTRLDLPAGWTETFPSGGLPARRVRDLIDRITERVMAGLG